MLLIPCPNCGERDQNEFHYGGRSIQYPALESSASDWQKVLHQRDNSSETIEEFWYHQSGCECWFKVRRHLITHEFES